MLADFFGKSTWDELTTEEKRQASGYGGAAHRAGKKIDEARVKAHTEK